MSQPAAARRRRVAGCAVHVGRLFDDDDRSRFEPSRRGRKGTTTPVDLALSRSDSKALDVSGPGGEVAAVLPPGPDGQWLIAGHRRDAQARGTPVLWRSVDGLSWSSHDIAPDAEGSFHLNGVVRHGDTTVVVGRELEGPPPWAVWRRWPMPVSIGSTAASSTALHHRRSCCLGPEGFVGRRSAAPTISSIPWSGARPRTTELVLRRAGGPHDGESGLDRPGSPSDRTIVPGHGRRNATPTPPSGAAPTARAGSASRPTSSAAPGSSSSRLVVDGSSWLASGHVDATAHAPAVWRSPAPPLGTARQPFRGPRPLPSRRGDDRQDRSAWGGHGRTRRQLGRTPHLVATDAVRWTEHVVPENLRRSIDGLGAVAIAYPTMRGALGPARVCRSSYGSGRVGASPRSRPSRRSSRRTDRRGPPRVSTRSTEASSPGEHGARSTRRRGSPPSTRSCGSRPTAPRGRRSTPVRRSSARSHGLVRNGVHRPSAPIIRPSPQRSSIPILWRGSGSVGGAIAAAAPSPRARARHFRMYNPWVGERLSRRHVLDARTVQRDVDDLAWTSVDVRSVDVEPVVRGEGDQLATSLASPWRDRLGHEQFAHRTAVVWSRPAVRCGTVLAAAADRGQAESMWLLGPLRRFVAWGRAR